MAWVPIPAPPLIKRDITQVTALGGGGSGRESPVSLCVTCMRLTLVLGVAVPITETNHKGLRSVPDA